MNQPISRFPVPSLKEMPDDIRTRIEQVQAKAGFIPNVFLVLAHRPEEFRGQGVATLCRTLAVAQIRITDVGFFEAVCRGALHESAPRLVRLDHHAVLVEHDDLIVDGGQHGPVQHLGLVALALGTPHGRQIEEIGGAA